METVAVPPVTWWVLNVRTGEFLSEHEGLNCACEAEKSQHTSRLFYTCAASDWCGLSDNILMPCSMSDAYLMYGKKFLASIKTCCHYRAHQRWYVVICIQCDTSVKRFLISGKWCIDRYTHRLRLNLTNETVINSKDDQSTELDQSYWMLDYLMCLFEDLSTCLQFPALSQDARQK